MTATLDRPSRAREALSKVPEVTIYFWLIKVLCTTVGESAADYLNVNLSFGLTGTSIVTGVLLAIALVVQFASKHYVPWRYWTCVAMVSVFGTLVTDNLTDRAHVALEKSTIFFSVLLVVVFLAWFAADHDLSIHSIHTVRREAFYWLAVLVSFALGTASGDLISEKLGVGYRWTGLLIAALIAVVAVAWKLGLHPVLSFWVIYVFTRPLGASIGDYLQQPKSAGGINLGTATTSFIFLAAILAVVVYLTITKADLTASADDETPDHRPNALLHTVVVGALLVGGGIAGYYARVHSLGNCPGTANATLPLGDMTDFADPSTATLDLLNGGNQSGATSKITDLEVAWDKAEGQLRACNDSAWTRYDGMIDTVLRELRANSPAPSKEKAALTALIDAFDNGFAATSTAATPTAAPTTTTTSENAATASSSVGGSTATTAAATASTTAPAATSPLGDLSNFRTITQDTLDILNSGDQAGATTRIKDLETAWDDAQASLQPRDPKAWTAIDTKIDQVLTALRAKKPDANRERTVLTTLLAALS